MNHKFTLNLEHYAIPDLHSQEVFFFRKHINRCYFIKISASQYLKTYISIMFQMEIGFVFLQCFLIWINVLCSIGKQTRQYSDNILDCVELWSKNTGIIPINNKKLQNLCINSFLRETDSYKNNIHDKNISNYLKSLLRKLLSERSPVKPFRGGNRAKRQTVTQRAPITVDRLRHEVRALPYEMVWSRFANRTRRLNLFSVSMLLQ